MSQDLADPFGATEVDEDPFATPEDVKSGGTFTPRPRFEDLEGELVVLIPRKLDEEAKDPFNGGTREQYTVDLVVLGDGVLTFDYTDRQKDGDKVTETTKEFSAPKPALFEGMWVPQANIIGQLKKVHGTRRPMVLGVVKRGPQAEDRKAGKTVADIEAAFKKWRANPKGNAPRFSWIVDFEISAEQRATAVAWWASAKDTVKL